MKIAITGGAGFIGTALAELLQQQGHSVTLLDLIKSRKFPEISQIVNIANPEEVYVALQGADAVYHLAAVHRDDVKPMQKYFTINTGGAENVAIAAREHNIHTIVYASTAALYSANIPEARETNDPVPFNDYTRSKFEAEKIFRRWSRQDTQNKAVVVRLAATFGPGNRGSTYTLIEQIVRGRFIMVGDGDNRKSIAWIGNVVAFLARTLDFSPGFHLCNYADKPDMSMSELVGTIREIIGLRGLGPKIPYSMGLAGGMAFDAAAQITGKSFPITAQRVKKFCSSTVLNTDTLRKTGFEPPYTLQDALKQMIEMEFSDSMRKSKAA